MTDQPVLTLRITPELKAAIDSEAKRVGISASAWVRRAVERELTWVDTPPPTPTEKRQQAREEKCPHPMHNRSKGQCLRCGEVVKR